MTALNSEGLEKIKLCPLCRHVAREADPVHSTEGQIDSGYGPLSFGVECGAGLECGCKVDGFPDQSSAIAAWNRRALPPVDGLEVVGAVEFLLEAAVYFSNRPTGGEDMAHWSNVLNAENCTKAASSLSQASSVIAGLTAERDEAIRRGEDQWAGWVKEEVARKAAEARISSLEEENKRLREALDRAMDWIGAAPHDDHCFTNDPNPDACRCVCGKDTLLDTLEDHNG